MTFGVSLEELEKDAVYRSIPKFIVECMNIIEEQENIRTDGIYRASGKKETIDKIKKKVNHYCFECLFYFYIVRIFADGRKTKESIEIFDSEK